MPISRFWKNKSDRESRIPIQDFEMGRKCQNNAIACNLEKFLLDPVSNQLDYVKNVQFAMLKKWKN